MGDYSIACGMTGLSTMGRDVVMFLLERSADHDDAAEWSHVNGTGGVYSLYHPKTLSLFGTMDSYGNVIDIVKDKNYELINEKYFDGLDFTGRRLRESGITKYAMVVLREAWDEFSNDVRYASDGEIQETLSDLMARVGEVREDVLRFIESRQEEITEYRSMVKNEQVSVDDVTERLKKLSKEISDWGESWGRGWHTPPIYKFLLLYGHQDYGLFQEIYGRCFLSGTDLDELIARNYLFTHNMGAANKLFMPTFHGRQYEDTRALERLTKLTQGFIDQELDRIAD